MDSRASHYLLTQMRSAQKGLFNWCGHQIGVCGGGKFRFHSDSMKMHPPTAALATDARIHPESFVEKWVPPRPDFPASLREQWCIPEDYDLAKWPAVSYPPNVEKSLNQTLCRFSFTPCMLKRMANQLYELPKPRIDCALHTGKRAAVMVPLCDVNGVPSVLLTLRTQKVRTHKGQVSFPGGHLDLNDECMEGCAQRECMEELGLRVVAPTDRRLWEAEWRKRPYYPESNVLGRLPNCVAITGTLVTPIVGYLGPIDMRFAESLINPDEVAEVFSMSIRDLMTPTNVIHEDLRMGSSMPAFISGKHRVWGLTAYILHHFLMNIMLPSLLVHQRSSQADKSSL